MVIARAPVRISFAGGGTDLAAYYTRFGGLVLSAAITRYSYVVASPSPDGSVCINSGDYRTWQAFAPGAPLPVEEPLALPKAALEWFTRRGLLESGAQLFLTAEIAPGTGLGSSSAMAVALARALAAFTGLPLDARGAAELACELEIERLHMPIGKQDQYASAFGGLNLIEFATHAVTVTPLRLPADTVAALSSRLLLFATGFTHSSADILQRQRADTATNPAVIASLHRIKALADLMCEALERERLDDFGGLLHRVWMHKRTLSDRVTTGPIDHLYECARAAGALGGKITGAGGGGFLLLYCPPARQKALRSALAEQGMHELPFVFDFTGAVDLTGILSEHAAAPQLREATRTSLM
jgi:D-glycero-alpha-D-manno-heptose-7-phosphate kinase